MKFIIIVIGTVGIMICFLGFIYQYRARNHLKSQGTLEVGIIKSFKRAPIEDYSSTGQAYLGRSDNCAAIGVSMVLIYAITAGIYD